MYVDSPAIIIQQINDGRYLSVRRKCRATRHVQWSMPHHGLRRYKALPVLCGHYVSPFHEQEKPDSATGSAYRVTECDRTTINIDPTLIPFKHLANRKRLCSKRFISLDKIDISQLPANTLRATAGRIHRRNSHQCRIHTNAGKCADAGQHG